LEKEISQKIKVWEFKEVIVGSWSYLVVNQLQIITAPYSMGFRRLENWCFLLWTSLLQN
jgi:hypothetical protein